MAVKFVASHKNRIGLSTDTKPAAASTAVPVGSKLFEYDTRKTFITYDGTNRVAK